MISKIKHPQIETDQSIKRIRQIHDEIGSVERQKNIEKEKIEGISAVSYLLILLKLAQKKNDGQRRIEQQAIIERLRELELLKGNTLLTVKKITGIKIL